MKKIMALVLICAVSSPLYGVKFIVHNLYGKNINMVVGYDQYKAGGVESYTINPGYNEIAGAKWEWQSVGTDRLKSLTQQGNYWVNHINIGSGDFNDVQLKKAVEQGDLSDGVINIVIISPSETFLTKNGMRQ